MKTCLFKNLSKVQESTFWSLKLDSNGMWNAVGDCIRKVARKVLGVSKRGLTNAGGKK